jgi:hypothetical protein
MTPMLDEETIFGCDLADFRDKLAISAHPSLEMVASLRNSLAVVYDSL